MQRKARLHPIVLVVVCLFASFDINAAGGETVPDDDFSGESALTRLMMYHHFPGTRIMYETTSGVVEDTLPIPYRRGGVVTQGTPNSSGE